MKEKQDWSDYTDQNLRILHNILHTLNANDYPDSKKEEYRKLCIFRNSVDKEIERRSFIRKIFIPRNRLIDALESTTKSYAK